MKIESLKLVYFSPTGTTKNVLHAIAEGINHDKTEVIDFTKPERKKHFLPTSENDLLIVGVPVYMGRVPAIATEWLRTIKANNTPVVCVVVYGNREFDNSLLELKDILTERGCVPIAGAAYIGEHSFSSHEFPIAEARPDINDLKHAELFGKKISDKLFAAVSVENISDIKFPGSSPYDGATILWDVDFIDVSNDCNDCGTCAEICPAGAIDHNNSNSINIEECILCCACIKSCPQNARTIKPGLVKDAATRLNTLFNKRKEPVNIF